MNGKISWTLWCLLFVGTAALVALGGYAENAITGKSYVQLTVFKYLMTCWGMVWGCWSGIRLARLLDTEHQVVAKWLQGVIASVVGFAGLNGFVFGVSGVLPHQTDFIRACGGIIITAWAFAIGLGLVRLALRGSWQPLAVARTVVDEAIRMKIAVVFIAGLLLILPVLPFALEASEPLRYRVQSFLSYSFTAITILLGVMSVFLACGTICNEIRDKQIYTIMTKPLSHLQYLIGKWIGIMALNAVLVIVCGSAVYCFTFFYLTNLPPLDEVDGGALHEEVLTARTSIKASPPQPVKLVARWQVQSLRHQNPDAIQAMGGPQEAYRKIQAELSQYAQGAGPFDLAVDMEFQKLLETDPEMIGRMGGEASARERLRKQMETKWLSVGPFDVQEYTFEGFPKFENPNGFLQFRYKIQIPTSLPNDQIKLMLVVNGRNMPLTTVVRQHQVLHFPTKVISPEGKLTIAIVNADPTQKDGAIRTVNPSISFDPKDGMEILYKVGSFGPNYAKAMTITWLKLAFVTMVGLVCGTFVTFPVACLSALLIFIVASSSQFLMEAFKYFGSTEGDDVNYFEVVLKMFGWTFTRLFEAYGHYTPGESIVEGRYIAMGEVVSCFVLIAIVWTGATAGIGWVIFRSRELARVQV